MARCKNSPEVLRAKTELADRLRVIRTEKFGERGGPELSRKLNLPVRTWYNYEVGVTVPAEVLLRFVELTGVEPTWLLHGKGPKYRAESHHEPSADNSNSGSPSVYSLLRRALDLLDQHHAPPADLETSAELLQPDDSSLDDHDTLLVRVRRDFNNHPNGRFPNFFPIRREWVEGYPECQFLRQEGQAMEPILSHGALIAYATKPEAPELLDNALVVYHHQGKPLVRWLQLAGRFALLRPENPSDENPILPIDLEDTSGSATDFRRVLWSCTPHGNFSEHLSDSDWLQA